ncbi:MAG: SRPBCC family protein [Solirubrobacteraceae bacterium]
MSTVQAKINIRAPVQIVWETVMDPDRLGDWVTIHRSLTDASPHQLRKGSTMEQVLRMRGVSFRVRWTLVDVRPPRHAEWKGHGPAGSCAWIRYQLSGEDDGSTAFEYMNEFTAPGGRLGNVASRMIVGAASERESQESLKRLKALLEHG